MVWCDSGDVIFNAAAVNITTTGFLYWIVNVTSAGNSSDVYPKWFAYGDLA
jgi:hypothetical protein